jgi:SET domain-containing protein
VATKDIAAGQEIFLPYGEDYWKEEAIMHAKFRNTRSKIPISRSIFL